MPEPLVIAGCGGHGREALGIVAAINRVHQDMWRVVGFVDDAPTETNLKRVARLGVPFLGTTAELAHAEPGTHYVVGIGDPRIRAVVAGRIDAYGMPAARLVHPVATVGLDTLIGDGVVIFAGVRVTTNVRLGRHVHLNQNTTVGHDSVLSDYVSVNPLAAVSGDCTVGERVLIGTTAAVLQGLTVGADATVGAGACVVRDVPPAAVVKGIPAR